MIIKASGVDVKTVKAFCLIENKEKTIEKKLYGFVYFETEESVQLAMSQLIGTKYFECLISVSVLMPKSDLKLFNEKNVQVKSLRSDVTEKSFYQVMSQFGTVLSVRLELQSKIMKYSG